MYEALTNAKIDEVRQLLKNNKELSNELCSAHSNDADADGRSDETETGEYPICIVARSELKIEQKQALIDLLLEYEADVNATDAVGSAFDAAIEKKDDELILFLISKDAIFKNEQLHELLDSYSKVNQIAELLTKIKTQESLTEEMLIFGLEVTVDEFYNAFIWFLKQVANLQEISDATRQFCLNGSLTYEDEEAWGIAIPLFKKNDKEIKKSIKKYLADKNIPPEEYSDFVLKKACEYEVIKLREPNPKLWIENSEKDLPPLHCYILNKDRSKILNLIMILLQYGAEVLMKSSHDQNALELAKEYFRKDHKVHSILFRYAIFEECMHKIDNLLEKLPRLGESKAKFYEEYIETLKQFKTEYRWIAISEEKEKRDDVLIKLDKLIKDLQNQTILTVDEVELYKYLFWLRAESRPDLQLLRYRYSAKRSEPGYLTFINPDKQAVTPENLRNREMLLGFYHLPEGSSVNVERMLLSLITSLRYENQRHQCKDAPFRMLEALINKLDPQLKIIKAILEKARQAKGETDLHKKINAIDPSHLKTQNFFDLLEFSEQYGALHEPPDYFGENLSDDSDSEQEHEREKLPKRKQHLMASYSTTLFKRSQTGSLFTIKGDLYKSLDSIKYDKLLRQTIVREEELKPQVLRDLERLNYLISRGELNEKSIQTISTKFFVAQYRGIHYRTDYWNQKSRKLHRKTSEVHQPLFSPAVLTQGGYPKFIDYFDLEPKEKEKITEELLELSQQFQEQLLQLKFSGPIRIKFSGDSKVYLFDDALLALQNFYTKDYEKFKKLLSIMTSNNTKEELEGLENIILCSLHNPELFLVSTSDTPEHALRYAYGDKAYESYKDKLLQPRWHRDGKAERPYSGKVYISLHEPLELYTKTHHVVSLYQSGNVDPPIEILHERETSFFGFMPPKRVCSEHIAKFPSFRGDYKQIYLEKYGLSGELFKIFKTKIFESPPDSEEHKLAKRILTMHLISFQEVCLIEEAKIAADNLGGVLVYRNEYGGFGLYPCVAAEPSNLKKEPERKSAIDAKNEDTRGKRNERKAADPPEGFLVDLAKKYRVKQCLETITLEHDTCHFKSIFESLIASGKFTLDILKKALANNRDEIFKKKDDGTTMTFFHHSNQELFNFIALVAKNHKIQIKVHSPKIDDQDQMKEKKFGDPENVIHIYYLGGVKFKYLVPVQTPTKSLQR